MSPAALLGKREILDQVRARPDDVEAGLRILKEDLEVGEGTPVDLLAADATGRPSLLFAAAEASDGLLLHLLDGIAWAGAARSFFERIGDRRLDCAAQPRAFLVLSDYPDRFRGRLAALAGLDLTLIRVEAWRESGTRRVAFLREPRPGGASPVPPLDAALRPLWEEAGARLRRLDPELEVAARDHHLEARFAGRLVAVLGVRPDRLRALVPDEMEGDVRDRRALHRFLDAALRRCLGLAAGGEAPAPVAPAAALLTKEELGELTR